MPPSGHSRSSHSSSHSSHSSSRSSSRSHSSSSRSHSSSSHSSSYRSSRSSYGGSRSSSGSTYRRTQPLRTRTHQPTNYRFSSTHPTTTYTCKRHDYVYYPVAWLDESTNTTYQNGYYDEQGNRYDNLILKNNEKYENVPMHCEYCETTQVRDLTDDNETMTCPHCGANMVIDAILDERADEVEISYNPTGSYNSANTVSPKGKWRPFIIVAIVIGAVYIVPVITSAMFVPFYGLLKFVSNIRNPQTGTVQQTSQQTSTTQTYEPDPEYLSNEDIFGMVLYLKSSEEGMLIGNSTDYEKNLIWNDSDECYYDASSDCYVWFNTDLDPSLWQYWYEGISSDYGDYGWMEYEDGKWYIETDYENWEEIDLTGYGDRIWHFADAYASDYWEN